MTALSTTSKPIAAQPIAVVLTSSGSDVVKPGAEFVLGVTIHNMGSKNAVINADLKAHAPQLSRWSTPTHQQLALGSKQSDELTFRLKISPDALPEIIEYDLIIDASKDYSELAPIRYERHRLQVLPADRLAAETGDPIFYLSPQTTVQRPAVILPMAGMPVQIWVENRSDRVDRFRLDCAGLPADWAISIDYPTDYQGLGLVRDADSIGLNPGDRGQILLNIKPPVQAIANIYVPTLRLTSQNTPALNLLELLYLQVNPTYLLQTTLQILRNQVRQQSALFEVQLVNAGNTPRHLHFLVENLDEPKSCLYHLDQNAVVLPPQATQQLLIEGTPQRWWKRPLYGGGRLLNFRVKLRDDENHPLLTPTLQSNLLWMARPWWQLFLGVLAVFGLLGLVAGLLWYLLRPPPAPSVSTFEVSDGQYSQENGDFARVNWVIEHPQAIRQLNLTGYSAEGNVMSGPLSYDLSRDELPPELTPFCTEQSDRLTCNNLRTDASHPGEYTFELTLLPTNRRDGEPIVIETSAVAISARSQPVVTDFFASHLRYYEAVSPQDSTDETDETDRPEINSKGILLNWNIAKINNMQALKLIGKTEAGEPLGEVLYPLIKNSNGEAQLPEVIEPQENFPFSDLRDYCELGRNEMKCSNVPTTLQGVGTYQFELVTVPLESSSKAAGSLKADEMAPTAAPILTELITVVARSPEIIKLFVDGKPAAAKYIFPINLPVPDLSLLLRWEVEGGATTQVKLLPAPGTVRKIDQTDVLINPEPGSTTLTLQAENADGESVSRSIVIETYDPTPPVTPEEIAAAAVAAAVESAEAIAKNREAENADSVPPSILPSSPPLSPPTSSEPAPASGNTGSIDTGGSLSPTELPPRFN